MGSFFARIDQFGRANVKISYQKVLQILRNWCMERSLTDSVENLEIDFHTACDWNNYLRELCQVAFDIRGTGIQVR